jgi:putative transposase
MPTHNQLTWKQKCQFCQAVIAGRDAFAVVCRTFRIARQTGYKWWRRYRQGAASALVEKSRRPLRPARALRPHWLERIAQIRHPFPRWGPKKLRTVLRQAHPRTRVPSVSSIGRVLRRLPLSQPRPRRPRGPLRLWPAFRRARRPNDVWTVDFKGHFPAADGTRGEPLTVRDRFSRYGLCAKGLPDRSEERARGQFVVLFRRHGQPHTIHCDQGGPFGSAGPAPLSRLSAWWVSLGIEVEFSRRARPGDNAAHEQWHRELKAETARPPAVTLTAQPRRTQRWLRHYNQERPHEALGQQTPAHQSRRPYRGVRPARYPRGWEVRRVQQRGEINWRGRVRFVSEALAGYAVGLRRQNKRVWHVYFYEIFIGELHDGEAGPVRVARYRRRVRTRKKVSTMS